MGQFGVPCIGPGSFNEPNGVGVDSRGHVFVADSLNDRIQEFDSGDRFVAEWGGAEPGSYGPRDIAVGADDTLYVLDQRRARVVKRSPDGTVSAFGRSGPAMAGSTIRVVADPMNQRIVVFDTDGRFLRSSPMPEWGAPFEYPDGLVVVDGESILASSPSTNEVLVFALDGRRTGSLRPSTPEGQQGPSAMAPRPGGGIFVVDFPDNRVSRMAP